MTSLLLQFLKKIPKGKFGAPVGILIGVAIIGLLGYRMRIWQRLYNMLGIWMWAGLGIVIVAGVLAFVFWYLPKRRKETFVDEYSPEDDSTLSGPARDRERHLQEKMSQAIRTLEQAPALPSEHGSPIYALPWYLLIGAPECGKTTLLQRVAIDLPSFERLAATTAGPTQDCDWWFFKTAVILDTAGKLAVPVDPEQEGVQWYRLLQLLRQHREQQPISGLLVAVAADALLLQTEDQLRVQAGELRKRLHEAIRELGVHFPVYILITRCDLIDGFREFFQTLPDHARQQVFGHVFDAQTAEPAVVEEAFEHFESQIDALQLAMLNGEAITEPQRRRKLVAFPEEFRALRGPCCLFIETLFSSYPLQHTPILRGLFFNSALQQGSPVSSLPRQGPFQASAETLPSGRISYFLHDLFALILFRDRYLVAPTAKARQGRLVRHLVSFALCVGLGIGMFLLVTQALRSDALAVAGIHRTVCSSAQVRQEVLLTPPERCLDAAQRLSQQAQKRPIWSQMIANRSGRLAAALRRGYVDKFKAEVLTPIDTAITEQLDQGTEPVPLIRLLIDRVALIEHCQRLKICSQANLPKQQLSYALMLKSLRQHDVSQQETHRLKNLYEAYLNWIVQGEHPDIERQHLVGQLEKWFAKTEVASRHIVDWANQTHKPVELKSYWGELTTLDQGAMPRIEGAYTATAWQQDVLPLLQRTVDVVPATQPLLHTFIASYRTDYFQQWSSFLKTFSDGEGPWRGTSAQRRELAEWLLRDNSPYGRVFIDADENLQYAINMPLWNQVAIEKRTEVSDSAVLEPEMPLWVQHFRNYYRGEFYQSYTATLAQMQNSLGKQIPQDNSFKFAQAVYREGVPSERSQHPMLKTLWELQQARQDTPADDVEIQAVWELFERPILLLWKVILEETGAFLQQAWQQNVLIPSRDLPKMELVDFLYGSKGKVPEFVETYVKPFLIQNESQVGGIAGEQLPLSEKFLHILAKARQLSPLAAVGQHTHQRITVEALRPSRIESRTGLSEARTTFRLSCANGQFTAATPGQGETSESTTVFWSPRGCGEPLIIIDVACKAEACAAVDTGETSRLDGQVVLRLTKRYRGEEGFLTFLKHFRDGKHTLRTRDFARSNPSLKAKLRAHGMEAIHVYFQVQAPAMLAKFDAISSQTMVVPRIVKD